MNETVPTIALLFNLNESPVTCFHEKYRVPGSCAKNVHHYKDAKFQGAAGACHLTLVSMLAGNTQITVISRLGDNKNYQ